MQTDAERKPDQNRPSGDATHSIRPIDAFSRFARVFLAIAAVSLIVIPLAYSTYGMPGLIAAAFAALVCLFAAGLSGLVSMLFQNGPTPLVGILLAMFIRMGLPLCVCMLVHLQGGWLSQAGFAVCLLVYYPVALAIETWSDVGAVLRSQTMSREA